MKLQIQITAPKVDLSEAMKDEILRKAEKLETYYDKIMKCRIVVEMPHRHSHTGTQYLLRIEMKVPGSELVVKRQPHEDFSVAVREAFDAARRQLEDYARRQRGAEKHHEEMPCARIRALFPDKGYGFLSTPEGLDVYFHKNSVINRDFNHLKVGMEVRFVEEQGEKGPQASTVTVRD